MKKTIVLIIAVFVLSSCIKIPPKVTSNIKDTSITVSGNVVNQDLLVSGVKIVFTDLKAGPLAVADDQTDKISLKVIQGVTDTFLNSGVGISITNDPHEAGLVFEGYIEENFMPGKFSKMFLFKHQARISVSGEIYERRSGLRVLSFAALKSFDLSKENSHQAALSVGTSIGQFIVQHMRQDRL